MPAGLRETTHSLALAVKGVVVVAENRVTERETEEYREERGETRETLIEGGKEGEES